MTQKTNPLKLFLNLFIRNWGLKIIALLLAILIYHSLKPKNGSNKSLIHERQPDIFRR